MRSSLLFIGGGSIVFYTIVLNFVMTQFGMASLKVPLKLLLECSNYFLRSVQHLECSSDRLVSFFHSGSFW